ncbi:MAG: hypothetical protein AAF677_12565 [Pseudomonadota bacterium]
MQAAKALTNRMAHEPLRASPTDRLATLWRSRCEHALPVPAGARLPFQPRGPVFRLA